MHFCADEMTAVMAAVPILGYAWSWARSKWRTIREHS